MKVETTTKLIFTEEENNFLTEVREDLNSIFCDSFRTCKNCPFNIERKEGHNCMATVFFHALDQVSEIEQS